MRKALKIAIILRMAEQYTVQQAGFNGPLDVLLDLIDKRKLSINDVSLSQVTEDYIRYIQGHNISKRDVSQFLVVAATLMLIKSISLLPGLNLTEEEEEDVQELERRLRLYRAFKRISPKLQEIFGSNVRMFYASDAPQKVSVFSPHESITQENLKDALKSILAQVPKEESLKETRVEKIISLEEMIDNLSQRIQQHMSMSFNEFSGRAGGAMNREARLNVIVSFLAMLELVKQEVLHAHQGDTFSDITIETR